MSWVVIFVILIAMAAIIAIAWLGYLVRSIFRESEKFDDDLLDHHLQRRNFFDYINPLAWLKRDTTTRLFYQRDRKGRFRKVRRH